MDQLNTNENLERKIEKAEVIEALKAKGIDDPETKELVEKWATQQEALIEQGNRSKAAILFTIERADLYVAIGDIDGALDVLDDARAQAFYENETELYELIMKRMSEM